MVKIGPSAIIEGVAALGIILSLIFVGLQMQQSSEIAMAGYLPTNSKIGKM